MSPGLTGAWPQALTDAYHLLPHGFVLPVERTTPTPPHRVQYRVDGYLYSSLILLMTCRYFWKRLHM